MDLLGFLCAAWVIGIFSGPYLESLVLYLQERFRR
jgi:hypothetical protein